MALGRVLITGGAGYIGSTLVPFLLKSHYRVRVLDRFTSEYPSLIRCVDHEGFEPVRGDCRDESLVERCLEGVDFVIPLAAVVGAPACEADKSATDTTNLGAILSLVALTKDSSIRILYPNSNSGYGTTPQGVLVGEETPPHPLSLYAKTKQQAEDCLLTLAKDRVISFRLATAFGPSPRLRLDLLVNDLVYRAVTDKSVVLYEPHFRRNFIHIHDAARLFHFGMQNFDRLKGRPYNAGLPYSLTKAELCHVIQKIIPSFQIGEAPIGKDPDQRDYSVSVQRLEEMGFQCSVSLERGIRELVRTYTMLPPPRFRNA